MQIYPTRLWVHGRCVHACTHARLSASRNEIESLFPAFSQPSMLYYVHTSVFFVEVKENTKTLECRNIREVYLGFLKLECANIGGIDISY